MKKDYVDAVETKYSRQLESVNFSQAKPTSDFLNKTFVKHLNFQLDNFLQSFKIVGSTEEQTHSKIKNIVYPDVIKPDIRMMILNAVYFRANWASVFNTEFTSKKPFCAAEKEEREVEMMHKNDNLDYYADENTQVLGLPYVGGELEMYFLLPVEKIGLTKLLANMDGKKLMQFIREVKWIKVKAQIPKFRVEKEYELKEVLGSMGMAEAFMPSANFSKMSTEPLYISKVIHKTFIENSLVTAGTNITAHKLTLVNTAEQSDNVAVLWDDNPHLSKKKTVKEGKQRTIRTAITIDCDKIIVLLEDKSYLSKC
ncbi:unnamed protein product [Enterobius vermicularis]|uniref:SERPIN domain-containing protein n=1 Tax=Enterobius vermicularis TaxID=51028 RepID=A0A0N4VEU4_ENTVE|nr:unnamed protein product [Enterobius vermicularis]